MSDESGYTKKVTDWLGREKEEHYGSDGKKVGETRFTRDWKGSARQEHFDRDGNKTGETRAGADFWGRSRAEHSDRKGNRTGYSRDEKTWLGADVQRHYDKSHQRVGESKRTETWWGQRRKTHFDVMPKVAAKGSDRDKRGNDGSGADAEYQGSDRGGGGGGSGDGFTTALSLIALVSVAPLVFFLRWLWQRRGGRLFAVVVGGPLTVAMITTRLFGLVPDVAWEAGVGGRAVAAPIDARGTGALDGVATLSVLYGGDVLVQVFSASGEIVWFERIEQSAVVAIADVAPIDWNGDSLHNELAVLVAGEIGYIIGPRAYGYWFLVFDARGVQQALEVCGHLDQAGVFGEGTWDADVCTEDEAMARHWSRLSSLGITTSDNGRMVPINAQFRRVDLNRDGTFKASIHIDDGRVSVRR